MYKNSPLIRNTHSNYTKSLSNLYQNDIAPLELR